MTRGPRGFDTPADPHDGPGVDSGSIPDGSTITWIMNRHHEHIETILRRENQMEIRPEPNIPIEDRLLRRVQIFSPGGDNERLMLEAAAMIRQLRREVYEITLLAAAYEDRHQEALSGGGDR
jgi:hypothetical protein